MLVLVSGDDIRTIADIVGGDNAYAHFVRRINKEFEIADEERNARVYVLYQENGRGKRVGFAVIGHSPVKMKVWQETFVDEGWVDDDYEMTTPCYELMYMYIQPKSREKGWGSKLFKRVLSFSRKDGIKGIYAYVGEEMPVAFNFYSRRNGMVIKDFSGDGVSNAFFEWRL